MTLQHMVANSPDIILNVGDLVSAPAVSMFIAMSVSPGVSCAACLHWGHSHRKFERLEVLTCPL